LGDSRIVGTSDPTNNAWISHALSIKPHTRRFRKGPASSATDIYPDRDLPSCNLVQEDPVSSRTALMGSMSIWHWLIVLVVVVLIFGTKLHGTTGNDLENAVLYLKKKINGTKRPVTLPFWIKVVVGAILFWVLLMIAERITAR
jgi:TatA/E family protein of Tat protein translocase